MQTTKEETTFSADGHSDKSSESGPVDLGQSPTPRATPEQKAEADRLGRELFGEERWQEMMSFRDGQEPLSDYAVSRESMYE